MNAIGLVLASCLSVGTSVVHVSPIGDDAADGSAARPVRTLVRARDLLRERRGGTGGGEVRLADGEYSVEETLVLSAADGGASPDTPVVWTAEPGACPRLTGGFRVGGFRPAGAAFPEGTLVADVKAQGYGDIPERLPFGYHSRNAVPPLVDLYCDGERLTLAREPNEGRWLRSMDNPVAGATNVVRTFLHRPERFTPDRAPDLMAHGYWKVFWADEVVKAEMTDAADCRLTFRGAYAFPGSRPEAMFYLFNAPTALDVPGEWYLDRAKGLLYVLPPEGAKPDSSYVLTRTQKPFVSLEGASNVVLEGLSLAFGGATAITGTNGVNVTIRGTAIRNFGGWGISFAGTDGLTVRGNVLDGFGRGGINVTGGDRRTLRDGRTHIEANDVGHTGRAQRTYTAALNYYGCGLVAVRNSFHDLPAHGVNARGNDILFASNVVERACLESDDQGGSDIFGNLGFRNVRYIRNVWRDIGPKSDFATCGAGGVRLDDAISGETVYGNRFIRCAQGHFGGVQVNGGLENVIDNNLFVGCKYAASFMYPNTPWQWKAFLAHPRSQKWHHVDTEIDKPPYSTRYPQLVDWPKRARKNRVTRNVAVGAAMLLGPDGAAVECVVEAADNVLLPAGADGEAVFAERGFDPLPPLAVLGAPEDDIYLSRARRMDGFPVRTCAGTGIMR